MKGSGGGCSSRTVASLRTSQPTFSAFSRCSFSPWNGIHACPCQIEPVTAQRNMNMRCEVIGCREHETTNLGLPCWHPNPAVSSTPLPSGPFQRYLDTSFSWWGPLSQSLSRLVRSVATRPAAPIPSRFVSVDPSVLVWFPLSTQARQRALTLPELRKFHT
jgi:hypothetical protein